LVGGKDKGKGLRERVAAVGMEVGWKRGEGFMVTLNYVQLFWGR